MLPPLNSDLYFSYSISPGISDVTIFVNQQQSAESLCIVRAIMKSPIGFLPERSVNTFRLSAQSLMLHFLQSYDGFSDG